MAGEGSGTEFTAGLFDKGKLFDKPEPLKGVRVLEVCSVVLGPATCDYLAEFGAEVIKFEGRKGDQMRYVTPYAYFWKGMSPGLEIENHNKYWVGMHVGNPKAKALFLELVKQSDVVVDNLTPGRMAEWGLDYRALREVNPKIVQLHVSGYGSWGPWTGRTSYDAVAQSMGALASITGFEDRGPIKSGVWIADWITGLMCANAILSALNYRERTGEGQFIDYLQVENVIRLLDWTWLYSFKTGEDRKRSGNRDLAICPSDLFDCLDGRVALAAFSEEEFRGLCEAMGQMDLYEEVSRIPWSGCGTGTPGSCSAGSPPGPHAAAWRKWSRSPAEHGFAASRVLEAKDVYHSDHSRERGAIQEYEDPLYGTMVQQCYPPVMSETPGQVEMELPAVGVR